jgi:hypothetical protein
MASIELIIKPPLKTQLEKAMPDVMVAIRNKVNGRKTIIQRAIGDHLSKILRETDVIKSLLGIGSTDLQAEFGLSDGAASTLVGGLLDMIKKSVTIIPGKSNVVISIHGTSNYWEDYLGLPNASYISQPSNQIIPVLRWMLIDPDIDIGQVAYDMEMGRTLVYDIFTKGHGFDSLLSWSRSGRAIMASTEFLQVAGAPFREGGYVVPDVARPISGANFIEYTIGQSSVAIDVVKIVLAQIGTV